MHGLVRLAPSRCGVGCHNTRATAQRSPLPRLRPVERPPPGPDRSSCPQKWLLPSAGDLRFGAGLDCPSATSPSAGSCSAAAACCSTLAAVSAARTSSSSFDRQHFLYFLSLPQWHGSLRPSLDMSLSPAFSRPSPTVLAFHCCLARRSHQVRSMLLPNAAYQPTRKERSD